ncbi:MAG: N-acetylmuramoyl-L-alanine amidase CwlD [Eubacteriales bacterium]|nr:N-acetylmuramoyl-L-alanine amidase CwlD [Eubacteriales bacterium]
MNRKLLIPVMSVLMLITVYVASNVVLPQTHSVMAGNISDNGVINEAVDLSVDFSGRCVVIDSGHGGIDPGKEGRNGVLEKDINLAIAMKLKELLEQSQIRVVMTRTKDEGLYEENDTNKKAADMKKRCGIINDSGADMVVSIHQNSFQSGLVKGAQVFYYKYSAEGKELAQIMQEKLIEELDNDNKRVAKEDNTYYLLINTKIPTVIAECGFLSNDMEAELLVTEEYQQKVAMALYDGIIEYLISQK